MTHLTLKAEIHLVACALVAVYSLSMLSVGPHRPLEVLPAAQNEHMESDTDDQTTTPLSEIDPGSDEALDELKEHAEALLDE